MRSSQNVYVLVSSRYDHLGRRVQKITPEATHTYFYDGWQLIKEVVERSGSSRRCGVSPRHCGGAGSSTSLGEDAAGCRVSLGCDARWMNQGEAAFVGPRGAAEPGCGGHL